jgi:hypothetical protein
MPPVNVIELDTVAFGRWAQRARLVLPVPLNTGYAARVTLDWDELLAVSEERLQVDNLAREVNRATSDLASDTHELLAYAESILRHPQTARATVDGESVLAVGLSVGSDGLVVLDTATTVTIRKTSSSELAATVVGMLPAVRELRMERLVVDERALPILRSGATARGLDRAAYNAVTAAGLGADAVLTLAKVQESLTARGMVGALRYGDAEPTVSAQTSEWFESTGGAVLRRRAAAGSVVFESATTGSLTSAAIAAMAGAR